MWLNGRSADAQKGSEDNAGGEDNYHKSNQGVTVDLPDDKAQGPFQT